MLAGRRRGALGRRSDPVLLVAAALTEAPGLFVLGVVERRAGLQDTVLKVTLDGRLAVAPGQNDRRGVQGGNEAAKGENEGGGQEVSLIFHHTASSPSTGPVYW